MDKLYFYKKSADKPPGKGIHDVVRDPSLYSDLAQIPNWRKILDEFHIAPIEYEGLHYNTAMHLIYDIKASLVDPDVAFEYALESNSDISRLDYHIFEYRNLVHVDPKEWQEIYRLANELKFSQHPDLLDILHMTRDAELWRTPDRGMKAVRRYTLEEIRDNR